MDNVTHSLVGLAAAKAGLERVSPYSTAVCVIAANSPDCDLLGYLGGRWFGFYHHRGITHSIVGVVALALLLPTIFSVVDYWQARRKNRPASARWGRLALVSLLLTASHPFLDWTNTYGVRPFLPWDGRWVYGDFAFVVEPFCWLALGLMGFVITARTRLRAIIWTVWGAFAFLVMLSAPFVRGAQAPFIWPVLWLLGAALAYKLRRDNAGAVYGRQLARLSLVLIIGYLGLAWTLHRKAEAITRSRLEQLAAQNGETAGKTAAGSLPGNPLRWVGLGETNRATYRFTVDLFSNAKATPERFAKPEGPAAKIVAQALNQDEGARIWANFARFPAAQVKGDCLSETIVQFADLRFAAPGDGRRGAFAPEIPVICSPETGAH